MSAAASRRSSVLSTYLDSVNEECLDEAVLDSCPSTPGATRDWKDMLWSYSGSMREKDASRDSLEEAVSASGAGSLRELLRSWSHSTTTSACEEQCLEVERSSGALTMQRRHSLAGPKEKIRIHPVPSAEDMRQWAHAPQQSLRRHASATSGSSHPLLPHSGSARRMSSCYNQDRSSAPVPGRRSSRMQGVPSTLAAVSQATNAAVSAALKCSTQPRLQHVLARSARYTHTDRTNVERTSRHSAPLSAPVPHTHTHAAAQPQDTGLSGPQISAPMPPVGSRAVLRSASMSMPLSRLAESTSGRSRLAISRSGSCSTHMGLASLSACEVPSVVSPPESAPHSQEGIACGQSGELPGMPGAYVSAAASNGGP